jgi:hypothetical protein
VQSALGPCSSQHRAGARAIATCREAGDQEIPARASADEVLLADETLAGRIKELSDEGVDHAIEVAFGPYDSLTRLSPEPPRGYALRFGRNSLALCARGAVPPAGAA